MSWQDSLRPASWRDQAFGVWAMEGRFGRNLAVHEYPFRDSISIEDLGRAGRRIRMTGFLVGGDVIERERAMIEAAEEEGEGTLVHPTLGEMQVHCQELAPVWRYDLGRVVELTFYFLEPGSQRRGLEAVEDLGTAAGAGQELRARRHPFGIGRGAAGYDQDRQLRAHLGHGTRKLEAVGLAGQLHIGDEAGNELAVGE